MTPKQLDYIINGAEVFIYRRNHDGHVYASVHDYSRFGVKAEKVVRVKLDKDSTVEPVLNSPKVSKAISAVTQGFR